MPEWRELASRRFGNFLLVGGVAAIMNVASRLLFSAWIGYEAAIVAAFFVGLTTAFIGNRLFVFSDTRASGPRRIALEFLRFFLVNIFGLAQTLLVSLLLLRLAFPLIGFEGAPAALFAHMIGVAFPVIINFFWHRSFTFGGGHGS